MHSVVSMPMVVTLVVLAGLLYGLILDKPADILFLIALVILTFLGVLTFEQAFSGFSNSAMLTVAALFVVAAGLRETGVMEYVGDRFLGRVETEGKALFLMAAVLVPSAMVLNNTPKVAMLVPVLITWCRKKRISPSRLLMPLSFLSILGGTCSLIGTSTNLVVQGLLIKSDLRPMSMFEVGRVGLPCALIGVFYLLTIGRKLLPDRKDLIEQLEASRREYLVEMMVQPGCRLVGKTVGSAGLRNLPGLFLIEIDREGLSRGPIGPDERIEANDRLVFTGIVGTIVDLEKIPGLVPAADARYEVTPDPQRGRQLCEAVISPSSPLLGESVREIDFRAIYDAAVVAVHRNGSRLPNKIGDIVLHAGDTLLLQVGADFSRVYRNNPDFYLVSDVEDSRPVRHGRARIAVDHFCHHDHGVRQRQDRHCLGRVPGRRGHDRHRLHLARRRQKIGRLACPDRDRGFVRGRQGTGDLGGRRPILALDRRIDTADGPDRHAGRHLLRDNGPERADQQ